MNDNLTEVVFILDKSGSMEHLTEDTIGGYNTTLKQQQEAPGEAKITTVLFSTDVKYLHDGTDIQKVKPLTKEDYHAEGWTALLDAVCMTIDKVGKRLANTPEKDRPGKVLVVITTDGMENSSKEYTVADVKKRVTEQTEKYNWQFLFLGANIDAISTGQSFGINLSANYVSSSVGTKALYNTVNEVVSGYRSSNTIDPDWAKNL